jgi:hypothetical protein
MRGTLGSLSALLFLLFFSSHFSLRFSSESKVNRLRFSSTLTIRWVIPRFIESLPISCNELLTSGLPASAEG